MDIVRKDAKIWAKFEELWQGATFETTSNPTLENGAVFMKISPVTTEGACLNAVRMIDGELVYFADGQSVLPLAAKLIIKTVEREGVEK